jgi:hypothetical protein
MLEGLLKLLNGEYSDEIVWTADITYWIAGQQQAGSAKAEWETEEGYLQLHRELGILPYYYLGANERPRPTVGSVLGRPAVQHGCRRPSAAGWRCRLLPQDRRTC